MQKSQAGKRIEQIAEKICQDIGVDLFSIEFRPGGQRTGLLRVYIDSPNGITAGNCAAVSKELSTQLDVEDFIRSRYVLEVSSPGLDRPIRSLNDAVGIVGRRIKVSCAPIEDRKNFKGTLLSIEDESLVLEQDGKRFLIPWEKVRKANLIFEV